MVGLLPRESALQSAKPPLFFERPRNVGEVGLEDEVVALVVEVGDMVGLVVMEEEEVEALEGGRLRLWAAAAVVVNMELQDSTDLASSLQGDAMDVCAMLVLTCL